MLKKKKEEETTEVKSILSDGLKIEGNVISEGKIRIDGTIEGDVNGDYIIFGKSAVVKGNIKAKSLVIMGTVEGNIDAEKLDLKSSAKVKGDISVRELSVEPGASVDGKVTSGSYLSSSNSSKEITE